MKEQVRALARKHGVRDRRRVRLEPPADLEQAAALGQETEPEQLRLAV